MPRKGSGDSRAGVLGQGDHCLRLDRPAGEDRVAVSQVGQVGHGVVHREVGRAVQDDPEGSFLTVVDDVHHRSTEVLVHQLWGSDQQRPQLDLRV